MVELVAISFTGFTRVRYDDWIPICLHLYLFDVFWKIIR